MKTIFCLVAAAFVLVNASCANSGAPSGDYSFSPEPIQSKTGIVVRHH
jgi:hypothetical protein